MTYEAFTASLRESAPPPRLPAALIALWHDAHGHWDAAHGAAQDDESRDAAWVHAYLHRKEGDPGNAAYWYRRAGKPVATDTLESEWTRIVQTLLGHQGGKEE